MFNPYWAIPTPRQKTLAEVIRGLQPVMFHPLAETLTDDWGAYSLGRNVMYSGGEGAELLTNGDFTTWNGAASPNDFPTSWTTGGTRNGTNYVAETTADQLNLVSDGASVFLQQANIMPVGDTYRSVLDVKSITGAIWHGALTLGPIQLVSSAGVKTLDFIPLQNDYAISRNAACNAEIDYASLVKIGELDIQYVGATLNNDTFAGRPCPTFDGINDYGQFEHNRLESVFDPDEGSVLVAIKMAEADLNSITFHGLVEIGADASNRFDIYHTSVANRLVLRLAHGGVSVSLPFDVTDYDQWLYLGCTYSRANARMTFHIGGKTPTTSGFPTAGIWAGPLTALWSRVGGIGGGSDFKGSIAHPAYFNREITAEEFVSAYNAAKSAEPLMA